MERGIITAPGLVSGKGSNLTVLRGLSPQEIRYFLLYWDKVVIPTNNILALGISEEEELISTGVFSRPMVPFSGTFNAEKMAQAQILAQSIVAKDLIENDTSVDWVLHQIGRDFALPGESILEKHVARIDLMNFLPVPNEEAMIPDILEFKERRRAEFLQLHTALDNFYFEILKSPDPDLESKIVFSELKRSIADIQSVTSEKWKRNTKFDYSIELNLSGEKIIKGAAVGAAIDFYSNPLTIPIGTIIGAAASLVQIKCKLSESFEPSKNQPILGYLAHAHKERLI